MDNKLLGLTFIVIAAFAIFLGFVFLNEPISRLISASGETDPSSQNSLIFAWPLEVIADGKSTSEITIFVRDAEGRGLAGHEVNITATNGAIQEGLITTDTQGKAIFHISSQTPGIAQIEALVDKVKLQRNISVQFQ